MSTLKTYTVWDASIRWFHWINLLCVLGLVASGVVILNAKTLGIPDDGKIILKSVHVWFGYVFAVNLLWRLIRAFTGGIHARWPAFLPGGSGYLHELKMYITSIKAGKPRQYLGHNPVGRIAVSILLLLLTIQALTGLVLAGTDIFFPPFGAWITEWIAAPGVDPDTLRPYTKSMYDAAAYEEMRALRKPFIVTHYYVFYTLITFILIHISAVVISEIREGGNLVSAMFSGKKTLSEPPVDQAKN